MSERCPYCGDSVPDVEAHLKQAFQAPPVCPVRAAQFYADVELATLRARANALEVAAQASYRGWVEVFARKPIRELREAVIAEADRLGFTLRFHRDWKDSEGEVQSVILLHDVLRLIDERLAGEPVAGVTHDDSRTA